MENLSKGKLAIIAVLIWTVFIAIDFNLNLFGFIAGLIFFWYGNKRNQAAIYKRKEAEILKKEEAQNLINKIQTEKKLEPITTSLLLEDNERAFLNESTVLMESKAIRSSAGTGVKFRVMRGVYVGGYKGQSESHQVLRLVERGNLILTNKKLVFRGTMENRVIPISKIIEVKMHADAIEIATTGRQKSSIFTVNNPYIWNVNLFILSKVENPLDFSNVENIEISIS